MKIRKRLSEEKQFISANIKAAKADYCLLCGKKIDSPCNSHSVPRFILKEIAEDGRIAYGYSLSKLDVDGLEKITGINNAHTFRLICEKCDNKKFLHYENPLLLSDFDNCDQNTQKIMLCEMAIKAHLSYINMKWFKLLCFDAAFNGAVSECIDSGGRVAEQMDIREHNNYIDNLTGFIKTNKNPFTIIFKKTFEFKIKIAAQALICYCFDLFGNQIFNPHDLSKINNSKFFYLMLLPQKDKTQLFFYIETKNLKNVEEIISQFDHLTEDEKVHFLFISLIVHSEQFYLSPSLAQKILENDKNLVKLYNKTDEDFFAQKKIVNFRKYNNYFKKD